MSLSVLEIKEKYPEVYDFFYMQVTLHPSKYDEKMNFWQQNNINCFERWTVPYFIVRDREQRRPCLRLNHPPEGKCFECIRGTCRYERICFFCGNEGHGAFQTQPAGKYKGQLRCMKHRKLQQQLEMLKHQHTTTDEAIFQIFASNFVPILDNMEFGMYGDGGNGHHHGFLQHPGNGMLPGGHTDFGFFNNHEYTTPYAADPFMINQLDNSSNMTTMTPTMGTELPNFLNFDGFYTSMNTLGTPSVPATTANTTTATNTTSSTSSTDMPGLQQILSSSPHTLLESSTRLNGGSSSTTASAKASPNHNHLEKTNNGGTNGVNGMKDASTFAFPSLYPGFLLPTTSTGGANGHNNGLLLNSSSSSDPAVNGDNNNNRSNNLLIPPMLHPTMNAMMNMNPMNTEFKLSIDNNNNTNSTKNNSNNNGKGLMIGSAATVSSSFQTFPSISMLMDREREVNDLLEDSPPTLSSANNTTSSSSSVNPFFPLNNAIPSMNHKLTLPTFPSSATTSSASSMLTVPSLVASSTITTTNHNHNNKNTFGLLSNNNQNNLSLNSSLLMQSLPLHATPFPTSSTPAIPVTATVAVPINNSKGAKVEESTSTIATVVQGKLVAKNTVLSVDYVNALSYEKGWKLHFPLDSFQRLGAADGIFVLQGTFHRPKSFSASNSTMPAVHYIGWSSKATIATDDAQQQTIQQEMVQLFSVSEHNPYVTKLLSPRSLSIAVMAPDDNANMHLPEGLIKESSGYLYQSKGKVLGTLDEYLNKLQADKQQPSNSQHHLTIGSLFRYEELQTLFHQLLVGLLQCHEQGVYHGQLSPAMIHILQDNLSSMTGFGVDQTHRVEYSGFVPKSVISSSLAQLIKNHKDAAVAWMDPIFYLPSATNTAAKNPIVYDNQHDVWSLGMIYYYLLFLSTAPTTTAKDESNHEAKVASFEELQMIYQDSNYRMTWLNQGNLYLSHPMLYDMLEHMLRPLSTSTGNSNAQVSRITLNALKCHPYFWTMEQCKRILISFVHTLLAHQQNQQTFSNNDNGHASGEEQKDKGSKANQFLRQFNKIAPLYVFGQAGWVMNMPKPFLNLIAYPEYLSEYWWSGYHLLLCMYHQLVTYPDTLIGVVSSAQQDENDNDEEEDSLLQCQYAYLHDMIYGHYPKLLILLYELSSQYGQWHYDIVTDEINFVWHA